MKSYYLFLLPYISCRNRARKCPGTFWENAVSYYKRIYGGCSFIVGNLILCDIRKFDNGTEPDLSFLKTIQHVTGFVYISRVGVTSLPLTSLRVIHGEASVKRLKVTASLVIQRGFNVNNTYLRSIELPSLTAIQQHNVVIWHAPCLFDLEVNFDWNQVFVQPDRQRLETKNDDKCILAQANETKCHSSCPTFSGKAYCWGPGPEACQRMVRCRNDKTRYCVDGPLTDRECIEECLGGCTGDSHNCTDCRRVLNGNKCESSCPAPTIISLTDSRPQPNPDFKYNFHNFCVKECPPPFLKSDSYCVIECDLTHQYDDNGFCRPCPAGGCPQRPVLSLFPIPAFLRNTATQQSAPPALSVINSDSLEFLGMRSLREIEGVVWLANLPKLCYKSVLTKHALVGSTNVTSQEECEQHDHVCHSECLPQAGCAGPGPRMCVHCCHLQAGPYCVSSCLDQPGYYGPAIDNDLIVTPAPSNILCPTLPYTSQQLVNKSQEELLGLIQPAVQCLKCHDQCAETCHGPNPDQCLGPCKNYKMDSTCMATCPSGMYVEAATQTCQRCSKICYAGACTGPGSFLGQGGCSRCLTVLWNISTSQYECLADDCPVSHFVETKSFDQLVHLDKHEHSRKRRESTTANQNRSVKVNDHGSSSRPLTRRRRHIDGSSSIRLCKPCHEYCSECTAYGIHKTICTNCLHWWDDQHCVLECPASRTYTLSNGTNVDITEDPSQESSDKRECLPCHRECLDGCSGPEPTDCVSCRNYKIMLDDGEDGKFLCDESCPEDKPRLLFGVCVSTEEYQAKSAAYAQLKRNQIVIGTSVCLLVLIIICVIIVVVCLRRRAEAEKVIQQLKATYANLLPPDPKGAEGSAPPNMSRLVMISSDDLNYGDVCLGSGSFGKVYKGQWRLPKAVLASLGITKAPSGGSGGGSGQGAYALSVAVKEVERSSKPSTTPTTPTGDEASPPTTPGLPGSLSTNGSSDPTGKKAVERRLLESMLDEAKVMASVSHTNCLPLVGVCLSRGHYCMVSVYVELGSLNHYVRKHKDNLDSAVMLLWAEQIASGMKYLEQRGIIHRDLAARNVLLQNRCHVQITDFGMACMLEAADKGQIKVVNVLVPVRWSAIETLLECKYSHKTDVWAYGVTLWEIFSYGETPYKEVKTGDIQDHVIKGGRLSQPDICTLEVFMVMVKCWIEDPDSRPTFGELEQTFQEFRKTPSRYLYIKHEPFSNVDSNHHHHDNDGMNQESHPLLDRGQPDGRGGNDATLATETSGLSGPNQGAGEDQYIQPFGGEQSQLPQRTPTTESSTGWIGSALDSVARRRQRQSGMDQADHQSTAPSSGRIRQTPSGRRAPLASGEASSAASWFNADQQPNWWRPTSTSSSTTNGPTASVNVDPQGYLLSSPSSGGGEGYLEPTPPPSVSSTTSANTRRAPRPPALNQLIGTNSPSAPSSSYNNRTNSNCQPATIDNNSPLRSSLGISNLEYFMQPPPPSAPPPPPPSTSATTTQPSNPSPPLDSVSYLQPRPNQS